MLATPDRLRPLSAALLLLVAGVASAPAADWPDFRGAQRDGRSTEVGLALAGPELPPVAWRVPMGEGYSGLVVSGGRLFTLYAAEDEERVVALDAADGREIWRYRLDSTYTDRQGNGPRSTPTVDGDTVYVLGAKGVLAALDVASGDRRWQVDLKSLVDARPPTWGVSTSPLIEGDLLLIDAGGRAGASVVALDKSSGRLVWSSQSDRAGYAAPLAITASGVRQVLFFTGTQLVSLAPANGALLWQVPWKTSYDVNAATPVFIPPNKVFFASGYDRGGALLRLGTEAGRPTATEVWGTRDMKNQFSSSVHDDGVIYGFDNKILTALDVGDGRELWRYRGLGHGSLIWADGHLIVLSERGELVVAPTSREEFLPQLRSQVLSGKCWTAPSLAGGHLYLRNEKELVALRLGGAPSP